MQSVNLTNHFLIAMPNMADPHFAKSLTYICEHSEQGALGLVVNRPTDMTLGTLFQQVEIPLQNDRLAGLPVYFGGPVQVDRGFVLHRPVGEWQSTLAVNGEVGLTTSKDILQALSQGGGPGVENVLVSLGYAGWAPGQIEEELKQNAWLTVPAKTSLIFDLPPADRLGAAVELLGIDLASLSEDAGHA
ncbi:MAG TPA: YqgE/AlgH family protein [Burkholderiales bacterium]|nr:YqgE/AlgH family protein [Burkholderiales bacterium]